MGDQSHHSWGFSHPNSCGFGMFDQFPTWVCLEIVLRNPLRFGNPKKLTANRAVKRTSPVSCARPGWDLLEGKYGYDVFFWRLPNRDCGQSVGCGLKMGQPQNGLPWQMETIGPFNLSMSWVDFVDPYPYQPASTPLQKRSRNGVRLTLVV